MLLSQSKDKINYWALIITAVTVSTMLGPIILSIGVKGSVYQSFMGVTLMYYIVFGGQVRFNPQMIILLAVAILSIMLNNPPNYFHSWQRLLLFCIIAGVISPLITNKGLITFRINLFSYLLKVLVIVTVVSFIGFFFGLNYAYNMGADNMSHFGGITIHSMILSPIASISLLYVSGLFLCEKKKDINPRIKGILFLVIVVSFLTILLAASRIGLLAAIAGELFLIMKLSKKRSQKVIKYILLIVSLMILTYPFWNSYATRIIGKNEANIEAGGFTRSRDSKWNARLIEFKSNPFFGVGYAAILEETGDEIDKSSGQIEPGSSWAVIFSMLGIFGFIPFAWLFFKNLYHLYIDDDNLHTSALLGSILFFFMFHMIAEGYIFGAGSFLFFILWLTIGVSTVCNKYSIRI